MRSDVGAHCVKEALCDRSRIRWPGHRSLSCLPIVKTRYTMSCGGSRSFGAVESWKCAAVPPENTEPNPRGSCLDGAQLLKISERKSLKNQRSESTF